jgi:hypothetical protein
MKNIIPNSVQDSISSFPFRWKGSRVGSLALSLCFLITTTSCDKNDDDSPQDPVSQLPPATMNGANTFGALLDGEPFIPSGGINPLDAHYQLINGERFFTVDAAMRDGDFNLISLSLSLYLSLCQCYGVRRRDHLCFKRQSA